MVNYYTYIQSITYNVFVWVVCVRPNICLKHLTIEHFASHDTLLGALFKGPQVINFLISNNFLLFCLKKIHIITHIFLSCLVLSVLSLSVLVCSLYVFMISICIQFVIFHLFSSLMCFFYFLFSFFFQFLKHLEPHGHVSILCTLHNKPPEYGTIVINCPNISTIISFYFLHQKILQKTNNQMYQWMMKIIFLKQQAMRNRAVSITYREWLGHRCVLLLSPALLLKPMNPQDHCDAAVLPSHLFCSRKNVNDWVMKRTDGLH